MALPSLLTQWTFDPLIVAGLVAAALLYVRGLDYSLSRGLIRRFETWRLVSFFAGLLVLLIALESVVDVQAESLLWVHMIQHDLITMVAPPLLLLGLPVQICWRAVPLPVRRTTLVWMLRRRWPWRLAGAVGRLCGSPQVALPLFIGTFLAWHVSAMYDLALEHPVVHALEHLTFLGTALLFWAQVIPARPAHARLGLPQRALYLAGAALPLNILGGVFVFSTGPLYPYYAALARSPGAPPTLIDQHLAGAAMDVPGTFVFFIAIMLILMRWLAEDERQGLAERPSAI